MTINLSIKHNTTEITTLTEDSIVLNTADKVCEDDLVFQLTGVTFWQGELV